MSDRPNILYVFTDQQAHDAMSCAGNTDVHTPAMDELAATGTRFTNTYCSFPLCTPSRASMFTGRPNHELEIMENGKGIPEVLRGQTLGELVSEAGYDCGYGGKWHVPRIHPNTEELWGFEVISGFNDNMLSGACDKFINRDRDKPFFLVASFDNPHNICEAGRDQVLPWVEVDGHSVPVNEYPNLPANFWRGAYEPQMLQLYSKNDQRVVHRDYYTPDRWRRYRYEYFRIVEMVDAQIGKIIQSLKDAGVYENTMIIFSSDHGEMCGAHEFSQKTTLYDEAAKVPLIISWPGHTKAGATDERLTSIGWDLLPTICDYANADTPEELLGSSLRGAAEGGEQVDWRDHVITQTTFEPSRRAQGGRMVRTKSHKYICYNWGQHREQLFDMINDPGEQVNLALEKRHADLLGTHRQLLADWCVNQRDGFGGMFTNQNRASIPGLGHLDVSGESNAK